MIAAFDAFQQLALPEEGKYQCTPLGAHRLGKDWTGRPCLVIEARQTGRKDMQLRHLAVEHGKACRSPGQQEPVECSIVTLTTPDPDLEATFLAAAGSLLQVVGPHPRDADVAEAFTALSALLANGESGIQEQGLWAEMLVMAESEDPTSAVEAWHAGTTDLLDFNWSGLRLEVKSTRSTQRRHHFRLEQLRPPGGKPPLVASVLLEAGGESLADLVAELRGRCVSKPHLRMKLDAALALCVDAGTVRFDRNVARRTLEFYRGGEIPCPSGAPNVSDVRFMVSLDGVATLRSAAVPLPFRPAAA